MCAQKRLQAVQAALEKRGVRSVHICLAPGAAQKMAVSDLQHSVANFLEAHLQGRSTRLLRIGDAPITA